MGEHKHAYWTTPTDKKALVGPAKGAFYPIAVLANVAIYYYIYKHALQYRNILYDDNDYNVNYTIINTSISICHLNISKVGTRCARLYFFIISILFLCVLIYKNQQ